MLLRPCKCRCATLKSQHACGLRGGLELRGWEAGRRHCSLSGETGAPASADLLKQEGDALHQAPGICSRCKIMGRFMPSTIQLCPRAPCPSRPCSWGRQREERGRPSPPSRLGCGAQSELCPELLPTRAPGTASRRHLHPQREQADGLWKMCSSVAWCSPPSLFSRQLFLIPAEQEPRDASWMPDSSRLLFNHLRACAGLRGSLTHRY